MSRYYIIYKTTNTINGKFYIGQHVTTNIDDGYIGSGTLLKKAISKYGKEKFTREIIEYCNYQDELNDREKYWISQYNGVDLEECYNISEGGDGGFVANSQETKDKISKTLKEYFSDPKNRERMSAIKKEVMNRPDVKKRVKEGRERLKNSEAYDIMIEKMRNHMLEYYKTEEGIAFSVERAKLAWEKSRDVLTEKMIGNEYCAKNYLVMDESGNVFEITNFTKFCKENNIKRAQLNYYIGELGSSFDELKYNQGFKLIRLFEREKSKRYKTYRLTFPNGNIETITNIKDYCRNNDLNEYSIYTVANTGESYRGILVEKLD